MKEEARYEYLKDIGLDLARPWPKGLKMEFGLGSGISWINFFLFPGVQNNVTRRGITSLLTHDTPRPPLRYHHRSHPSPRQFSNMQRYVFSPPLIAPRGRCPADGRHHIFHIWSVKVDGDPGTQLWWCFHCRVMWFLRECPQQRAFRGVLNRELIEGYGPGGYIDLDPD